MWVGKGMSETYSLVQLLLVFFLFFLSCAVGIYSQQTNESHRIAVLADRNTFPIIDLYKYFRTRIQMTSPK